MMLKSSNNQKSASNTQLNSRTGFKLLQTSKISKTLHTRMTKATIIVLNKSGSVLKMQ